MSNSDLSKAPTCFIGMNSPAGFCNLSETDFSSNDALYIIKGGPGTGKSRMMRDIADEAVNKGLTVQYYLCSSDPSSLDGIIIKELRTGMIDGTAPHVRDAELPAIRDNIVNVGEFWDEDKLSSEKASILDLMGMKSMLYEKAYREMSVLSSIRREITMISSKCILEEKASRASERIIRGAGAGECFEISDYQIHSLGMDGIVNIAPPEAENNYYICDRYGISGIFMSYLEFEARRAGLRIKISRDPVCPDNIAMIHIPDAGINIVSGLEIPERGCKTINMDRFIDSDKLRSVKPELKALKKYASVAESMVCCTFAEVKKAHFNIEKYYVSAMNFSRKRTLTKRIAAKIFG